MPEEGQRSIFQIWSKFARHSCTCVHFYSRAKDSRLGLRLTEKENWSEVKFAWKSLPALVVGWVQFLTRLLSPLQTLLLFKTLSTTASNTLVTASWRDVSNMKAWVPSATFIAPSSLWRSNVIEWQFEVDLKNMGKKTSHSTLCLDHDRHSVDNQYLWP